MSEQKEKEVLELAMQAGHLLLENGAEIFRVEAVSYTHLSLRCLVISKYSVMASERIIIREESRRKERYSSFSSVFFELDCSMAHLPANFFWTNGILYGMVLRSQPSAF